MALRAWFTTWAPFDSRQLFQFSMPLFYEPMHPVLVLSNLRVDRTWGAIRDDPFNVAVRDDPLEKLHLKRDFLEFNCNSVLELFVRPFELL